MTGPDDPRRRLEADRAETLGRLASLDREIAAIIAAAEAANADDEHDPEGATIAFEREHATALARQARTRLAETDAALRRLDEGRYGTCERCGKPVGAARLAARPSAATCIACARSSRGVLLAGREFSWANVGGIRQAVLMAETLTLMAVHAHPDDEASSTGGVLAQYSAQGIRTIIVTCTNGEFGDAPGQVKPGQDGHDEDAVAQLRLSELRESCKILGVTHLELLGYHDSGMPEWDYRKRPDAFCNVPLDVVSGRIVELIEKYRPQVVVSYDPDGAYQHPDHVQAAQAALAASRASGIPAKFYQIAFRRSSFQKIRDALRDAGEDVSDWDEPSPEAVQQMAAEEARITTMIDISGVMGQKREALMSHASQISDSWFSKIPPEVAAEAFGYESFVRVTDTTGEPVPETDLFAGLR